MTGLNLVTDPKRRAKRGMGSKSSTSLILAVVLCLVSNTVFLARPAVGNSKGAPVPSSLSGFKGIVIGDACNLRTGPGTQYSVANLVLEGTWLDILHADNNWLKIRYKAQEAWIASWLVDIDLNSSGIRAVITRTDVNVRQGPGTNFPAIGMTQRNCSYPAEAKRGDWIRISLGSGRTGWVNEPLLELTLPALEESDKVDVDMLVRPRSSPITVFQFPLTGSASMARLGTGDSARYITSKGAWIAVETSNRVKGWVYGPDTVISSTKDPGLSFGVSESSWSLGKYSTISINATDVNFRSGPGTNYPVISMVQRGDVLRVLETKGQWIRGISPKGVAGWVASWLTIGTPDKSPGFSIVLDASSSTRTLTIQGPFQSCRLVNKDEDNELIVSTSALFQTVGKLDINFYEFESVKVEGSDITIKFSEKPSYTVREQTSGKAVLGFAPTVTAVNVEPQDDGETLTIHTLGYTWPNVSRNGSSVSLFLPGASYAGEASQVQGKLVRSVGIDSKSDGVSLSLDASQGASYLLKKNTNSLEAYFHNPGVAGKTIVIDPGHGGSDPGASGPTGHTERTANWEIAVRLRDLLQDAGAQVIMTRLGMMEDATPPDDWNPGIDEYSGDLAKRAAWSSKAHAFISIHNDWHSDKAVAGTTSYVCNTILNASESHRLAELIQKETTRSLGTYDRGVRNKNFFVNRESHCPSVLVEVMYLSNPREEALLKQGHMLDAAARGIFRAIHLYFSPAEQPAVL